MPLVQKVGPILVRGFLVLIGLGTAVLVASLGRASVISFLAEAWWHGMTTGLATFGAAAIAGICFVATCEVSVRERLRALFRFDANRRWTPIGSFLLLVGFSFALRDARQVTCTAEPSSFLCYANMAGNGAYFLIGAVISLRLLSTWVGLWTDRASDDVPASIWKRP